MLHYKVSKRKHRILFSGQWGGYRFPSKTRKGLAIEEKIDKRLYN